MTNEKLADFLMTWFIDKSHTADRVDTRGVEIHCMIDTLELATEINKELIVAKPDLEKYSDPIHEALANAKKEHATNKTQQEIKDAIEFYEAAGKDWLSIVGFLALRTLFGRHARIILSNRDK